MLVLFLFSLPCVVYDPLNLLLHPMHSIYPPICSLLRNAQSDSSSATELEQSLIFLTNFRLLTMLFGVHLCIVVVRKRILSNKLRDLYPCNEIFIRLGHEIIVARLPQE